MTVRLRKSTRSGDTEWTNETMRRPDKFCNIDENLKTEEVKKYADDLRCAHPALLIPVANAFNFPGKGECITQSNMYIY